MNMQQIDSPDGSRKAKPESSSSCCIGRDLNDSAIEDDFDPLSSISEMIDSKNDDDLIQLLEERTQTLFVLDECEASLTERSAQCEQITQCCELIQSELLKQITSFKSVLDELDSLHRDDDDKSAASGNDEASELESSDKYLNSKNIEQSNYRLLRSAQLSTACYESLSRIKSLEEELERYELEIARLTIAASSEQQMAVSSSASSSNEQLHPETSSEIANLISSTQPCQHHWDIWLQFCVSSILFMVVFLYVHSLLFR